MCWTTSRCGVDGVMVSRPRSCPRIRAARGGLELAEPEAVQAERLERCLGTVEDVGGGELAEREHLPRVAGVEDRVDVLEQVVEHRIAVGCEPDDAAVRRGPPRLRGLAEA